AEHECQHYVGQRDRQTVPEGTQETLRHDLGIGRKVRLEDDLRWQRQCRLARLKRAEREPGYGHHDENQRERDEQHPADPSPNAPAGYIEHHAVLMKRRNTMLAQIVVITSMTTPSAAA